MKMTSNIYLWQKKLPLIVFFILLAFSVSIINAQQATDKFQSISINAKEKSFPIFKIGSHIFTKAALNGDEKHWVIDTGAGSTVVDAKYAKDRGLSEIGKSKARGAGGEVDIILYNIPKLAVYDTVIENLPVIGFDVYGLFKKKYNIDVAGIIGFNFLSKYVVKIDYDKMQITLFEPSEFKYDGTGNKMTFELANNIIMVPLKVDNKYEGNFALDSGASSTMFKYPFALNNKITEMDGPDLKAFGAQGGFVFKQILFSKVEFGSYVLDNVVIGCPAEQPAGVMGSGFSSGTIGFNILQHFVFYIDYQKKVMYVEKSSKFNQDFPYDKSGLQLETNMDNAFKIIHISNKSAAETAGLKIGDIVKTINGKNLSDFNAIDEIYAIFKDKEGTNVNLKIIRDSKESDVQLTLTDPFKKN